MIEIESRKKLETLWNRCGTIQRLRIRHENNHETTD